MRERCRTVCRRRGDAAQVLFPRGDAPLARGVCWAQRPQLSAPSGLASASEAHFVRSQLIQSNPHLGLDKVGGTQACPPGSVDVWWARLLPELPTGSAVSSSSLCSASGSAQSYLLLLPLMRLTSCLPSISLSVSPEWLCEAHQKWSKEVGGKERVSNRTLPPPGGTPAWRSSDEPCSPRALCWGGRGFLSPLSPLSTGDDPHKQHA